MVRSCPEDNWRETTKEVIMWVQVVIEIERGNQKDMDFIETMEMW